MAGEKILFADDEEQIRKLVSTFLQRRGYNVLVAPDGMEALKLVRQELPHLVITDVNMPYMNGLELTRRLRENHKTSRIPIVMLSARKQAEDILSGYQVGVDDYVPKPVEMAVLAAKVETLLRRSAAAPAAAGAVARQGKVVLFLHGKGGTGATTLAVNTAVALGTSSSYRTAVFDLNLEFPNAAMLLDLKPERTLADIGDNVLADQDDAYFSNFVQEHASGVTLVSASDRPEAAELVSITNVQQAIDRLKARADYVIVDSAATFSQITLAALDASDGVVVVTNANLPSLKAALDVIFVLTKLQYPRERTLLVLNRTGTRGLDYEQIEQFFGRKPDLVIPCTPLFDDAADQGKPLVLAGPDSTGAATLRELAAKIASAVPVEA
ncbi:MAG: response regulator [Chloroflexi bacterium]|nr:response regulator [Chloroflexota bacterium]